MRRMPPDPAILNLSVSTLVSPLLSRLVSNKMNTKHLAPCMIDPIPSCGVWAGIFTGIDAMQGAPLSLRKFGFYAVGLWSYHGEFSGTFVLSMNMMEI